MADSYEARILEAALDDDTEEMQRLIADMLPGERRALLAACAQISGEAGQYCQHCHKRIPDRGPYAAIIGGTFHAACGKPALAAQAHGDLLRRWPS